jgi:hypothetical protein
MVLLGQEAGKKDEAPALSEEMARLRETLARLRLLRSRFHAETLERREKLASVRARRDELSLRVGRLRREAADVESEIAGLEAERRKTKARVEDRVKLLKGCSGVLRDSAGELGVFIETGIPFHKEERRRPVKAFLEKEARGDPAEAAHVLQHLFDFEISLGSTSAAFQGRIDLQGERPRTRFIRVGLVYMAFITEDGNMAGVLLRHTDLLAGKTAFAWKADFDRGERWRVRKAVEIVEKRRPPSIVRLPVDLSSVVRK